MQYKKVYYYVDLEGAHSSSLKTKHDWNMIILKLDHPHPFPQTIQTGHLTVPKRRAETGGVVGVGEGQADGLDEGPAQLDREAAPVRGNPQRSMGIRVKKVPWGSKKDQIYPWEKDRDEEKKLGEWG